MKVRNWKNVVAASVALSAGAVFANEHAGSHVTIGGMDAKLGAEYKFEFQHNDDKRNETESRKAQMTNTLGLKEANVTLSGKVNEDVVYDFGLDVHQVQANDEGKADALAWGWVQWNINDMFSIRAGRDYTNAGGWDQKFYTYSAHWVNPYSDNLPVGGSADVMSFIINTAGTVTLQLANDVVSENPRTEGQGWNDRPQQPAFSIEYSGDFGGIKPLFQYGVYDLAHSSYMALGLALNMEGINAHVDYIMDNRSKVKVATSGALEDSVDVHTSINLAVSYDTGSLAPFLKVSTYDVKQEGTDAKVNSAGKLDDNATMFGVGVDVTAWGEGFVPYADIRMISGKEAKGTGTETKSGMILALGTHGKF